MFNEYFLMDQKIADRQREIVEINATAWKSVSMSKNEKRRIPNAGDLKISMASKTDCVSCA